ncbi:Armadillo-type fold [Phytophthora cactorum]|nr:Armadillo-type fold [Phytophthora cactorum]
MEAVNASRPDVIGKLPQLQNMVKRDPVGYRTEFLMQLRHFESEYQLFLLQPTKESAHFGALVSFLSHVAKCYPTEMAAFPEQIMGLLRDNYLVLEPELRKTLVQSLMLLRNRGLVDAITLLKLFFELFRCPDKRLRELLYKHIVSDIRQLNATSRNVKVNKALQNFLFEMLKDDSEHAAIKSLQVLMDLFKRKIWHDQRSVNVIVTACTSKNTKLLKKALVAVDFHAHSKKTKKRQRDTLQALIKNKRARKRELDFMATFPAIELLNDPQGVAERQLKLLKSCTERFEVKLLMMNFIGRVLGFHKLVVLPFYPLLQRYLQSHQQNVTAILAYLVQSCHDEIPPEELLPIVKSIAHNFVTERCSSEVIAVGINSLRELFRRVPLLLECEGIDVLVSDLVQYNRARDKTIVMAARGVLNLIRDIHPALLKRKDRGKFHNDAAKPHRLVSLWRAKALTDNSDDEWVNMSSDEEDNEHGNNGDAHEDDAEDEESSEEAPQIEQKDRLDARRILTPLDFERIEMLKKERDAALKDPKSRSKRKAEEDAAKASSDATKVNPTDLEGYSKKKRLTQEERLRVVLKAARTSSTSAQVVVLPIRKEASQALHDDQEEQICASKVLVSARQVQHQQNRVVKKILKHDAKKRRKI